MNRTFVSLGAFLAGIGVILGAFGTHALRDRLSEKAMETWHTGVLYHMIHAVALVIVGLLCAHADTKAVRASGWLFVAGIMIFGGTLYAYSITGITAFAIVTPLGGLAFILGWMTLAVSLRK